MLYNVTIDTKVQNTHTYIHIIFIIVFRTYNIIIPNIPTDHTKPTQCDVFSFVHGPS